jgi:hypothetical protein
VQRGPGVSRAHHKLAGVGELGDVMVQWHRTTTSTVTPSEDLRGEGTEGMTPRMGRGG